MLSKQKIKHSFTSNHLHFVIPGNKEETINYAAKRWIEKMKICINTFGKFTVALSGGGTPNAIFSKIVEESKDQDLDWNKVFVFWSDERCVPPDSPESNYNMAMSAAFGQLPIPKGNIFRMVAESDLEANAKEYERLIRSHVPNGKFDLIMLGVGEDGHTASLFPNTDGLHMHTEWVIGNHVPQRDCHRMSFTFSLINRAKEVAIYALGRNKSEIIKKLTEGDKSYPVSFVGTSDFPAMWIIDEDAASLVE